METADIVITATDKRQYSSVAYALRAVLAVQQEMLLAATDRLPPLEPDAVDALKDLTDIYTLGALQLADRRARLDNESVLTAMRLEESWARFAAASATPEVAERRPLPASAGASTDFRVIREIIAQKIDGSSQGSVQLWPVPWLISQALSSTYANKSSIVIDLRGWRTPSVSGEELQALGKSGPRYTAEIARGLPVPRG